MDTFKAETYSDGPDNLEKGCPATGPWPRAGHIQPEQTRRSRSIAMRHWIAFGAVTLIWLVSSYGRRVFYDKAPHVWRWADDRAGRPPPPDGDIDHCVGGTNWTTYYDEPSWSPDHPYGAETTFSLPLDSNALFLVSRGVLQGGLVNVEQSTEVADTVDVRVRVAYSKEKLLGLASVCQLERTDKEYGVGIFTPRIAHRPPHHYEFRSGLEFDVTITLPAGSEGPLFVKKFETHLPNYSQNVAALGETVVFDEISLKSANGRLSVQSVTSEFGQFSSLNGEVDGQFNARSALELNTANGRITPTVNLLHREGEDPSYIVIHTINGQIDAEIALSSGAVIGGEFEVDAQSKNGGVVVKFTESPVDSVLKCVAETTVGAVQVELDGAFEGTYSLENVLGPKVVSQHDVEDPAGRARRRVVSVHEARGRIEGEVKWVESDGSRFGNEGHVVLKSVTSSIKLVV